MCFMPLIANFIGYLFHLFTKGISLTGASEFEYAPCLFWERLSKSTESKNANTEPVPLPQQAKEPYCIPTRTTHNPLKLIITRNLPSQNLNSITQKKCRANSAMKTSGHTSKTSF